MSEGYPALDELYVVSDLHLGGEPGFQICHEGETLASLIEHIAGLPSERRVGLVLNGDIVDFLAESPGRYLRTDDAIAKLQRIIGDAAFAAAWKSLAAFVRRGERHLTLVLGNHDVELALPPVRAFLRDYLCGNSGAARARLRYALDGAGFRCSVGDAEVLCLHGNEVDPFNVVDFEALLDVARAFNRAMPIPRWSANAGTRLVIDVMNQVKKKYRWVDLLKPEIQGVIPVLVAVEPSSLGLLRRFGGIITRLARDGAKMAGLLGEEEAVAEGESLDGEVMLLGALSDTFPELLGELDAQDGPTVLRQLEASFDRDADGLDFLAEDEGMLGPLDRITEWFEGKKEECVRRALLTFVGDDLGIDVAVPDSTFSALDGRVGPEVSFLVSGHTHMAKGHARKAGPGYYFNSGTWISLMRLEKKMLETPEVFAGVWDALEDGSMEALKRVKLPGTEDPLLHSRPTVVQISRNASGTEGTLRLVIAKGKDVDLDNVQAGPFRIPRGGT